MQTVGCPLSSFPAPERVDIYADLPGKSRFAQAKLVPERGNLLRREFAFDCRALRQEAISGNKGFEQVAARSNWRILASLPAIVDSSMPSFWESCSCVNPRVIRSRFSFPIRSSASGRGLCPRKAIIPGRQCTIGWTSLLSQLTIDAVSTPSFSATSFCSSPKSNCLFRM
jgi:hypothetical protein